MNKIRVKIEIPKYSTVKYELDSETGILVVDRILPKPIPYNYGFVPDTLWDDGDALDVILIGHFELVPGCEVYATPVAVIGMTDNDKSDYKLVCSIDPYFDRFDDVKHEVVDYLKTYKNGIKVHSVRYSKHAIDLVLKTAHKNFNTVIPKEYW